MHEIPGGFAPYMVKAAFSRAAPSSDRAAIIAECARAARDLAESIRKLALLEARTHDIAGLEPASWMPCVTVMTTPGFAERIRSLPGVASVERKEP
jgi:hypothetical protein